MTARLSIPLHKDVKTALTFCGSKSGRGFAKFKECGRTAFPGRKISATVSGDCHLHYECRVV